MQSPDESQVWGPGQSLWSLIAEHVSESELPKIYTALGHSLVDVYTDMHTEAEMWHKMWQENQRSGKHGGGEGTPLPRLQGAPLADPPAMKELLRAEVKMLLQTLREKASRAGSDVEELLHRYKPETLNYTLGHRDRCYTNCTNPEDTDSGSRPDSRCSVQSRAEDEIEAVRGKLNVTEIDQVVDRLRALLIGECEELTRLVKHLKANIKQKCHSGLHKSEPSLADLRELRGAIQVDLELSPFLFSPSSPLPAEKGFRLPAAQSSESLKTLSPPSVLRPHPPPPLSPPIPRPPARPRLSKMSTSRTHEQDSAGLSCWALDSTAYFEVKSERNSPLHKTHLSVNCRIHSQSTECEWSPQRERKNSPACRPKNINITPSPVPAPSGLCNAGSKSTDQSVAAKWKSGIQNRQQDSSCEGSLESARAQSYADSRRKMSENSVMSETWRTPVQTCRRKSNGETSRNLSGPFRNDGKEQQNLGGQRATLCPSCSSTPCSQRPPAKINEHFFTSSNKPQGGSTSQPKEPAEPQFLQRFHQPVPPTRVPT
ncbi:coiled-coil domain-containing protein 24 isoform X2 [Oreochromis aureus]|uniref:Coiled-coil domain containing 24 n=1 Tax=Oreochromis aureus TaxID=47969 RepID=A0AAZ1XM43_OREAU|nr:coiled-coil domain-containing protein 24 isoform X2 [Oreochromis aureus]